MPKRGRQTVRSDRLLPAQAGRRRLHRLPLAWRTSDNVRAIRNVIGWLNDRLGIKIGHPFAGHRRIAQLFNRFPLHELYADYRTPGHDIILFIKPP